MSTSVGGGGGGAGASNPSPGSGSSPGGAINNNNSNNNSNPGNSGPPPTSVLGSLNGGGAGGSNNLNSALPSGGPALLPSGGGPNPDYADDLLKVEVQGENGAYYRAHVKDVLGGADEVLLSFENNWQSETRFPVSRVRLPPPPTKNKDLQQQPLVFAEGQEIEVYSRASDQESCGWWRAVIKMSKGQ